MAISVWAATSGLAVALGPVSWRSAARALLVGFGVHRQRADHRARDRAIAWIVPDVDGTARSAASTRSAWCCRSPVCRVLVWSVIEGPHHGWLVARRASAAFALAGALLSAFVAWERRSDHPMLDVGVFSNMRFTAGSLSRHVRLLRTVRLHLHGDPVLPVRPRLRHPRGRRAHRAVRRVHRRSPRRCRHSSSTASAPRSSSPPVSHRWRSASSGPTFDDVDSTLLR